LSANQNPHELNQNAPPVRLSAREAARQRRNGRTVVAAAPPAADNRTFLEKLFGGAPQSQTASPALGYAPAEGGVTTAARSVCLLYTSGDFVEVELMASFQISRRPSPRSAFGPKRRKLARDEDFAQAQKSMSSTHFS